MQNLTAPILAIPDDVFRMIFLELYRGPLGMAQLRKAIPASQRQHYCRSINLSEIPTDPLSIAACSQVCRRWAAAIHKCSELQSSIVLTLPLDLSSQFKLRAGLDDPRHIFRFLGNRRSIYPVNVRIFTCTRDQRRDGSEADVNALAGTANCLVPLINCTQTLTLHGSSLLGTYVDLRRFDLRNLQHLTLDGIHIGRELLETFPYIKVLKLFQISYAPGVSIYATDPKTFGAPVRCPHLESFECYEGYSRVFFAVLRTMILTKKTRVVFERNKNFHVPWGQGYGPEFALLEEQVPHMWPLCITDDREDFLPPIFGNAPGLRCMEFIGHSGTEILSRLDSRSDCNLIEVQCTRWTFSTVDITAFYDSISATARLEDGKLSSLVLRDCRFEDANAPTVFALLEDKLFFLEIIDTRVGFHRRTAREQDLMT